MADIRPGFATVLAATVPADDARALESAEQLDLLGAGLAGQITSAAIGRVARRAGRPVGSRNRRTQEWQDYILARYGSPLEGLAQLGLAMSVDELATALGCKPLEAMDLKRKAMADLAPYIHQRQPLAVTVEGRATVALHLGDAPEFHAAEPGNDDALDIVEFQDVSQSAVGIDGQGGDGQSD